MAETGAMGPLESRACKHMHRVLADARIFRKSSAVRTNNGSANTTDAKTCRKRSPSQARVETMQVSSHRDILAKPPRLSKNTNSKADHERLKK